MSLEILNSVGGFKPDGSASFNSFSDVLFIKYLLNKSGILVDPLPLDGEVTPDFIQAIEDFETIEDTVPDIDGRIDPFDEAWTALNNTPLPEFEGIEDRQEQRMIIQRPHPEWNFSRGRFKTLTDAGFDLSFHPTHSAWLPDTLKNRLLLALGVLLDPEISPAPTFGVHVSDWSHIHLGLWSRQKNVSVSPAALLWKSLAGALSGSLDRLRLQHLHDLSTFEEALTARLNSPEVQALISEYAQLPEAVMVHHTFELKNWRPSMLHTDPRRHWMVTAADEILTPPYRDHEEMREADDRGEFVVQSTIQLSILMDTTGVIHPVLGVPDDLKIYSGFELSVPDAPPGPGLE